MDGEVEKPKKKRKMEKWTPRTIRELIQHAKAERVVGIFDRKFTGESSTWAGEGHVYPTCLSNEILEALESGAKQLDAIKKRLSWMFVMNKKRGG